MADPLWPPNWAETINRFVFNREITGTAKDALYLIREPSGITGFRIWNSLPPVTDSDEAALAAFYLFDLDSALVNRNIEPGERERLRVLRHLLRLDEGVLLRHHPTEVERIVLREIGDILQDDQVTPGEALRKVDLQEALGLGYDEYVRLASGIVEAKIRPWLQEQKLGLSRADFERRWLALDSLILLSTQQHPLPSD